MDRTDNSEPRRRVHLNQDSNTNSRRDNPNQNKVKFILDESTANHMRRERKIFQHSIDGKNIYFPYQHLHEPQKAFLQSMFDCLDKSQNLLIESPTGTGKTLNLLVGALSWAEQYYQNSQGQSPFDNQTKIIYTSRAHSQLSQISKQLKKTPYRPKMLLFGSREKLCINQELQRQILNGQKSYQSWAHKCNIAVRMQQNYLGNQKMFDLQIERNKKVVVDLKQKMFLNQQQKEELQLAQQFLKDINLRCTHYHDYQSGIDANFMKYIGREVLNNQKLKEMARQFKPHSICPYYYPKRVKIRGTLYLMPYNYILDSNILQYSAGFLSNSIIIFDQGHNAPKTACDGFSISISEFKIQAARRNINQTLKDQDFDADELDVQIFIRGSQEKAQQLAQQEKQQEQEMDDLIKQIRKKNKQKKGIKVQDQKLRELLKLKQHVDLLTPLLKNIEKNFQSFFEDERVLDLNKADSSFSSSFQESSSQRRNFFWKQIRSVFTHDREQIKNWIDKIFFSQMPLQFTTKSIQQKLSFLLKSTEFIIQYFIKKDKRFFKLMNFSCFFDRLKSVLFNESYRDKFFLQITQSQKYDTKTKKNIYRGEVHIKCLAPQFAFKLLESMRPRSIIITSGTLSPIDVFAAEIGLTKMNLKQVDPVITGKNILVRKITKDLKGNQLKIDSTFYNGRYGLQYQNLYNLFDLLTKTVEKIPHGVLVIVSSFSCLQNLQRFYKDQNAAQVRQKLQRVKPHVYFEPKKNLEETMDRFNSNSVTGKGAILFCVCRAKLSEGIDFKDRLCRSVIFLGIPYVNKNDSFIASKGNYLKSIRSPYATIWKFIEASKAINQGLGRTVRHSKDFGSILLFDDRYQNTNRDSKPVVDNISQWIKKQWRVNNNPHQLEKQLAQFYQKCLIQFPFRNEDQNELQNGQLTIRQSYAQML